MLPGAAPIRRLNWFTLFLLAAIVAASLSIYRGWATERDLHLARIDGHNIVQFNPVDPLASFDSRWWTAEDLAELQTLPVIADLAWDGTEHRTIAVGRSALVRTGVSPGYLSFFRTAFPAGRDLNAADADLPRAVISELMAGELFPDLHLSDVIGKTVTINQRPYTIVGVYEGEGPVYYALSRPALSGGSGNYDVNMVYARLQPEQSVSQQLDVLRAWLVDRGLHAVVTPVLYREVAGTDVRVARTPLVREMTILSRVALALCLLFAASSIIGQSLLAVLEESPALRVHRALGASALRLLLSRGLRGLAAGAPVALVAAGAGYYYSHSVCPYANAAAAAAGAGAAVALYAACTVVWTHVVLRSSPTIIGPARKTLPLTRAGARLGYAGMAALTALVTVAGSLAAAGERSIRQELEAIGIDRVELRSGSFYSTRPPALPTPADQEALNQVFPGLPSLYVQTQTARFSSDAATADGRLILVRGDYEAVSGTELADGRFWNEGEAGAVVGHDLAQILFPRGDALDGSMRITVQGRTLTVPVVGVAQPPGSDARESLQLQPHEAAVPLGVLPVPGSGSLHVRLAGMPEHDVDRLLAFMDQRHPEAAGFRVVFPAPWIRSLWTYFQTERTYVQSLSAMLLLISLIGSWAFLCARAIVRRPEYALRRAFGASRRNLNAMFAAEVLMHVGLSGLAGGAAAVAVLFFLGRGFGYDLPWPVGWMLAAFTYCLLVGLLLGWGTARQAATDQPIVLLREDL